MCISAIAEIFKMLFSLFRFKFIFSTIRISHSVVTLNYASSLQTYLIHMQLLAKPPIPINASRTSNNTLKQPIDMIPV